MMTSMCSCLFVASCECSEIGPDHTKQCQILGSGSSKLTLPMPGCAIAQVAALCRLPSGGVPATYLNSQQSAADTKSVYHELRKVRLQLCFVSSVRTHTLPGGWRGVDHRVLPTDALSSHCRPRAALLRPVRGE